jgi:uncharacterized protein involved in outer membrane biogenesis
MKKSRFFLVIVLVFILFIAGAVIYVLTNLNSIVKQAIEKYGAEATKTAVSVSSVDIKLSTGQGSIGGLQVANPQGFTTPDIFKLGNIIAKIDVRSVTKTPIVIQDIRITGPEVFYEMDKSGATNLDALQKNLESGEGTTRKEPVEQKNGEKKIRLFIRKLVLEKGRVEARIAALGDKPIILDLPRLELSDIGKNGGATPAEVAKTVATALAEETARVVARTQGERALRKGAEDLLQRYLGK